MNKGKNIIIASVLIIAITIGVIFAQNKPETETKKTSVRLKWISQAQFSGIYTAASEGFYEEFGLDVRIDPAGPNISPIQSVVSGTNEFGIAGAEQIIAAIDNGVPIVAIAVIYRETPEALVSLKEANIKEPKDLIGKTVGVVYGDDERLYRMFLKNAGIDEKSIKEVPAITGISQTLTKKVDAKMAYEMNDYILLQLEGEDVDILRFRDYGVKFYADTIFTTKELIEKDPEKVHNFVQATIKGWEEAINNPEKAIDELVKVNPTLNYKHQLGYLKASIPIIKTDEKIGYSSKEIWQNMINDSYDNGTIKNRILVDEVFTNEFVSK